MIDFKRFVNNSNDIAFNFEFYILSYKNNFGSNWKFELEINQRELS